MRQHVESAYHPCGTCRMGDPADPMAVVDPETRVDRPRGPARGRLLDHALDHHRQPQRADDHDRPRRPPTISSGAPLLPPSERAGLRGAGLADGAAMMQRSPAHPPGTLTNRRTRFAFRSASWTRAAPHSGGAALQGGVVQRWRLLSSGLKAGPLRSAWWHGPERVRMAAVSRRADFNWTRTKTEFDPKLPFDVLHTTSEAMQLA